MLKWLVTLPKSDRVRLTLFWCKEGWRHRQEIIAPTPFNASLGSNYESNGKKKKSTLGVSCDFTRESEWSVSMGKVPATRNTTI